MDSPLVTGSIVPGDAGRIVCEGYGSGAGGAATAAYNGTMN